MAAARYISMQDPVELSHFLMAQIHEVIVCGAAATLLFERTGDKRCMNSHLQLQMALII